MFFSNVILYPGKKYSVRTPAAHEARCEPGEDEVFVTQARSTPSKSFSPAALLLHLYQSYWKSVQKLHFAFVKTSFCWEF